MVMHPQDHLSSLVIITTPHSSKPTRTSIESILGSSEGGDETRKAFILNFWKKSSRKLLEEVEVTKHYGGHIYHACVRSQAGIKNQRKKKCLKITRQRRRILYHACLGSQAESKGEVPQIYPSTGIWILALLVSPKGITIENMRNRYRGH